jgi:hypothetical protein
VVPALLEKVFETASLGSSVEQLSRIGIVKIDFACSCLGVIDEGGIFKIA